MNTIKMFVVGHKEFKCLGDDCYIPIQVGKAFTTYRLGYLSDDTQDNIALKNDTYCELTAGYWIWKNVIADIVGLCHYRRYFISNKFTRTILTKKQINSILDNFDIILPHPWKWNNFTIEQFYCHCAGKQKDIDALRTIIKEKYPAYYNSFEKIMTGNSASYCNMLICKKNIYDNYSKWLFSVLLDVENTISLDNYTREERRVFGYLSELLLNVWVDAENLAVKHMPIQQTDISLVHKGVTKIKTILKI